ncbi:hypothetical protein [Pseudomonas viridiflava]|uniref:hypothetical protein n=1 Tax=Pseudomonas viridiflava TaxID=33069 RepID=UPI000F028445|nr:hypothetical protein [Pseudomonas viridiflava]
MSRLTLHMSANSQDLTPIFRGIVSDAIQDYDGFATLINTQLRRIIKSMVRSAEQFQELGEDQITFHIISQYNTLGFEASHGLMIGGHVDISIKYEDYMWIGEAKKHSSYPTLQKGWEQLTSRYSTGMEGEDQGAFLIYNFNSDALSVTKAWKEYLALHYPALEFNFCDTDLNFSTKNVHVRSGKPYYVTHYNIPLHHDPKDRGM